MIATEAAGKAGMWSRAEAQHFEFAEEDRTRSDDVDGNERK